MCLKGSGGEIILEWGPTELLGLCKGSAVTEILRNNVSDGNWVYNSSKLELLSKI
jgi:hypothetical protein